MGWGTLAVLLLSFLSACATSPAAHRDERFVIVASSDFATQDVQRVRAQLEVGAKALEAYIGAIPSTKFPVVVNIRSGGGVSHSSHGRGPIELYWVREVRAPIVHELTHVLAGYTAANGHWTQEGVASYMQDRYGSLLPMLDVMRDRTGNGTSDCGLDGSAGWLTRS